MRAVVVVVVLVVVAVVLGMRGKRFASSLFEVASSCCSFSRPLPASPTFGDHRIILGVCSRNRWREATGIASLEGGLRVRSSSKLQRIISLYLPSPRTSLELGLYVPCGFVGVF